MLTPDPDQKDMFKIVKGVVNDAVGARLGTLSLPKRRSIDTPNFIGLTARGAIPHVTPDNVGKRSDIGGVYMALEDFMETTKKKKHPAILEMKSEDREPLHAFNSMPSHILTVLGARRHPAINSPVGNTKEAISIFTSTGFQALTNKDYHRAINTVKPDIAIPLADMTYARSNAFPETKRRTTITSSKRQLRMVERTEDWLNEFFELDSSLENTSEINNTSTTKAAIFAPLLPVPYVTQWDYFNLLEQDLSSKLSGLAVYDVDVLPDLEKHTSLLPLPRLSLDYTATPQEVLRQIHLGIDIFTVSFLNGISDAGIALSFTFPPPPPPSSTSSPSTALPLGENMWSTANTTSLTPLTPNCPCYTCTHHHRAFVAHLLNAKEMLGWTLLQTHNYQVLADFFAGVRKSLSLGTFERDHDAFCLAYESELPMGTGTRPRARGYHFKSRGGDDKINPPAWEKYGGAAGAADDAGSGSGAVGETGEDVPAGEMDGVVMTGATAAAVEEKGGMETPLVPDADVDAAELDRRGFAEVTK